MAQEQTLQKLSLKLKLGQIQIIEDAKGKAKVEADKIVQAAQSEISQEINSARLELKNQLGDLVISGASKILEQEIDQSKHSNIIKNLQSELS